MSVKSLLKEAIIDIISSDLKEEDIIDITSHNSEEENNRIQPKIYSDEEIKLYINRNSRVINKCINDYIEEFGGDLDIEDIDEDWIRDYLSEIHMK
jgi:hypothetical protein